MQRRLPVGIFFLLPIYPFLAKHTSMINLDKLCGQQVSENSIGTYRSFPDLDFIVVHRPRDLHCPPPAATAASGNAAPD